MNELTKHVHMHNGIIGIAHPKGIGDPICTGGSFNFSNVDYENIDFIEVWHGICNRFNEWEKNEMFWADKISKGNSITAIYGGDFHKKEDFSESDSFNWIQVDEDKNIEMAIIEAIKSGRVIMSKGPCFNMVVEKDDFIYSIGDTINMNIGDNSKCIVIKIDKLNIHKPIVIMLSDNLGQLRKIEWDGEGKISANISINEKNEWIRTEIIDKIENKVLAICNPIYFNWNLENNK